jgi:hypothetical protein
MEIPDFQVTSVDEVEHPLRHKLIDDEIVLIHKYKCKMASKKCEQILNK